MRRAFLFYWIVFCVVFTCMGCASVRSAIKDYEACKGDQACLSAMADVKEASYVITKSAASSLPLPSIPEAVAMVVSNVAAFGFGVLKGKKIVKP